MKQKLSIVALAAILLAALLTPIFLGQAVPATAAPAAAPTPVSINHSGVRSDIVTFHSSDVITADGNSGVQSVADHAVIDLQWVIDQGTVNTTTFKLQFSNDGVNWVDGATIATSNAADVNSMQQFAVFGRWARINRDVSNTNTLTLTTFIGVAK
jgi:hypothetical protein